jgi:hypothetical protein
LPTNPVCSPIRSYPVRSPIRCAVQSGAQSYPVRSPIRCAVLSGPIRCVVLSGVLANKEVRAGARQTALDCNAAAALGLECCS